jgi:hypothetical protein
VSVLAIAVALFVGLILRAKHMGGLRVIPMAALLVPAAITFEAFVYPADPEVRMWWRVAVFVGAFYGVVAASIGYGVAAFLEKQRGA